MVVTVNIPHSSNTCFDNLLMRVYESIKKTGNRLRLTCKTSYKKDQVSILSFFDVTNEP